MAGRGGKKGGRPRGGEPGVDRTRSAVDQGRSWRNEDGAAASRGARGRRPRGIARGQPREKKVRSRLRRNKAGRPQRGSYTGASSEMRTVCYRGDPACRGGEGGTKTAGCGGDRTTLLRQNKEFRVCTGILND